MDDGAIARIADGLSASGWIAVGAAFAPSLLDQVRAEGLAHAEARRLAPAATGRGAGRQRAGLRGDSTLWLDDPACGTASRRLLAALDQLRIALHRRVLPGLAEVEAHYALYPPGAGYARHRDRFRDDDARLLSLVLYLNPDWPDDAGGALRLHLAGGPHDILPKLGTTVLFLSDEVEHEVLPASQPRLSVAAWFRRRDGRLP